MTAEATEDQGHGVPFPGPRSHRSASVFRVEAFHPPHPEANRAFPRHCAPGAKAVLLACVPPSHWVVTFWRAGTPPRPSCHIVSGARHPARGTPAAEALPEVTGTRSREGTAR